MEKRVLLKELVEMRHQYRTVIPAKIHKISFFRFSSNMSVLVPDAEVMVEMNESDRSETTIGTDFLGPCLAFLLDFKFYGTATSFITYYSFSMKEDKETKLRTLETLIKVLEYTQVERYGPYKAVISGADIRAYHNEITTRIQ
jgi:hypothetical protein